MPFIESPGLRDLPFHCPSSSRNCIDYLWRSVHPVAGRSASTEYRSRSLFNKVFLPEATIQLLSIKNCELIFPQQKPVLCSSPSPAACFQGFQLISWCVLIYGFLPTFLISSAATTATTIYGLVNISINGGASPIKALVNSSAQCSTFIVLHSTVSTNPQEHVDLFANIFIYVSQL